MEGRLLGTAESPLTARGREQADELARHLAQTPIFKVMSSPRKRALDTAEQLAKQTSRTVIVDDRLAEIDFGTWELKKRADLLASPDAERLRSWEHDMTELPSGEELGHFRQRVESFLTTIATENGPIAVVTHVYVIKQILALVLGVPFSKMTMTYLDPGTVTVIEWEDRPIVRVMNYHMKWSTARWLS